MVRFDGERDADDFAASGSRLVVSVSTEISSARSRRPIQAESWASVDTVS
jgi:hypothetical protein